MPLIHPPVDGRLDFLRLLLFALTSKDAVSVYVKVFACVTYVLSPLGSVPGSEVSGSRGNSVFDLVSNLQTVPTMTESLHIATSSV